MPDLLDSDGPERYLARAIGRPGPLDTDCPIWQGATSDGYPVVKIGGRKGKTHHVHRLVFGEVPSGRQIHHRCEEPLCINRVHMEALTPSEHHARHPRPLRLVCKHKHPLSGANVRVYRDKRGKLVRACLTCARDRDRAYKERARVTRPT